ncbi:gamma-glutamyltransferase [Ferrimonas pelagia]|uniref:Glutathione hydrolase proenzyme n=1 Tax=Ferrimonas pelagia TaxID=1177826 RepID=A0ABP9FEX1_9GAMM
MRWIAWCGAVILGTAQAALIEPEAATGFQAREVAWGQDYMAATANPYATEAAQAILAQGGSAVDAAITAQMVLTLTEPQSSGIGGGLFMLLWDAQAQQMVSLDGRETAPKAATPSLFMQDDATPMRWLDAVIGGRAVGTPGAVAALYQAHQRYGVLPWSTLLQPAIILAQEGFIVSPRLAKLLAAEINPGLQRPGPANRYFAPEGHWLEAGQRRTNPELAKTLTTLANAGAAGFYQGPLALRMVEAVQQDPDRPGLLTEADLAQYRAQWRKPVCTRYRRHSVCGMGPPSSGGIAVGQIMALLEPHDIKAIANDSVAFTHLYSQASRLAYADRGLYVADSDYVEVPTEALLDPAYLQRRGEALLSLTDPGQAQPGRVGGSNGADQTQPLPSTTHMVMADPQGNLLSLTSSIEMGFGSTVMVGGFLLNNQLTDFSLHPGSAPALAANRVQGGKRPRSSMAPTIVLDPQGQPSLALGSPGGSRIINYVSQMLVALLDWQLPLAEALALPRISHRNDYLLLESERSDPTLVEAMSAKGYDVKLGPLNSGVQVIQRAGKGWYGAADPRREGTALGGQMVERKSAH